MAQRADTFDLGRLGLSSGEGRRIELEIGIDRLSFGGQSYAPPAAHVPAMLDIARTTGSGYSLRLRYATRLGGPCMRCLEDAGQEIAVDAREVHQPGGGDDLSSPYVDGDELALREWARDSLALALPEQIVCRTECLGLCAECGANLNEAGPGHGHERAPDPRFAKLSELRFD